MYNVNNKTLITKNAWLTDVLSDHIKYEYILMQKDGILQR